jgi:general secretion pathway protein C
MTTLLRRYPWVPSLLVGVLWIVAVVDARNQLRSLAATVVQLATARSAEAAAPVVVSPVRATPVWFGVSEAPLPVRQFGEHRFEVPRTLLEAWMGDLGRLRSMRIVPEIRDGQATGFRLYSIGPDSPLARLGFRNGDVVRAINGLDITTPEQALQAYALLKTSSSFLVVLERDGQRITNSYRID